MAEIFKNQLYDRVNGIRSNRVYRNLFWYLSVVKRIYFSSHTHQKKPRSWHPLEFLFKIPTSTPRESDTLRQFEAKYSFTLRVSVLLLELTRCWKAGWLSSTRLSHRAYTILEYNTAIIATATATRVEYNNWYALGNQSWPYNGTFLQKLSCTSRNRNHGTLISSEKIQEQEMITWNGKRQSLWQWSTRK